jgi:hypothetical protein
MIVFQKVRTFSLRIGRSKYGLILGFLCIFLLLGFFVVDDYGLSWDEYKDIRYGETTLRAYQGADDFLWTGTNRKYYGPFYWMLVSLISKTLITLKININEGDVWKYLCFLTFQAAIFLYYLLCTRFMKRTVAFFSTMLFATQPLLIGHAFINQKDIPFMSFFLASIVIGLIGVDRFHEWKIRLGGCSEIVKRPTCEVWDIRVSIWKTLSRRKRICLIVFIFVSMLLILELFVLKLFILPWMENIVRQAYTGAAFQPINWLFKHIAQDIDKTPIAMYIDKIDQVYQWGSLFALFCLIVMLFLLYHRIFVRTRDRFSAKEWIREYSILFLAGVLLGLTTSIRVAGPLAGVLVSVYFLIKSKGRSISALIIYWTIAFIIMYSTWPFLWGTPIDHFLESMKVAASFTQHGTLFQAKVILATEMPWYYLPLMMSVQFTEPLVVLWLIGIVTSIYYIWKRNPGWLPLILIIIGSVLPIVAVILCRIPIYDNFRQFLFLVPLLFVVSGIGLAFVLESIKSRLVQAIIIMLMLIPGWVSSIKLHPYEYIYYNAFIGGVDQAYRKYELDYWCTSLREMMDHVNKIAPPNSAIYIEGPVSAAIPFAREDLKINDTNVSRDDLDFAIACRHSLWREDYYTDFEIVYAVKRGNGILSILKERR